VLMMLSLASGGSATLSVTGRCHYRGGDGKQRSTSAHRQIKTDHFSEKFAQTPCVVVSDCFRRQTLFPNLEGPATRVLS
jgi:hypothetical protein